MSIPAPLAPPRGRADARAAEIARQLSRFRPEVQPRVRALARRHPWIADLAVSFPALLFALAMPRRGTAAHAPLRLILDGACLADIAVCAGVPLWLRAFPPQAFATPLPALPDAPDFRRRIANHLPARWRDAPRWIENVALAAEAGDADIALWFAREAPLKPPRKRRFRPKRRVHRRLVALWAWFSARPNEAVHALVQTPWRAELNWKAALNAALKWSDAMALALYLGDRGVEDAWLEDGEADGYSFVALRTRANIEAEAAAMKNCVRGYGASVAANDARLWSVRRNGERIATLSLSADIGPLPYITELSMAENKAAPLPLWLAARRWLHAQDLRFTDSARLDYRRAVFDGATWRALWRPYWLAKRRIPAWLPLAPSCAAFYDL